RCLSDWSSDVCSSDLLLQLLEAVEVMAEVRQPGRDGKPLAQLRDADREHLGHGERRGGAELRSDRTGPVSAGGGGLVADVDRIRSEERRVGNGGGEQG